MNETRTNTTPTATPDNENPNHWTCPRWACSGAAHGEVRVTFAAEMNPSGNRHKVVCPTHGTQVGIPVKRFRNQAI